MSDGGGDHAGYPSNALEKQEANKPFAFGHGEPALLLWSIFRYLFLAVPIARCSVHSKSKNSHDAEGYPVTPVLCIAVSHDDRLHLVFGIPIDALALVDSSCY